jgi:Flp pilus assembly protein TadB
MFVIAIKVLLLIILTYLIYNSINHIQQSKAIEKSAVKMFSATEKSYNKRKGIEESRRLEDGNQEKQSFIYKLDLMIERSGLRKKIPFLNTELYIGITVVLAILGYIIITFISGIWLLGAVFIMLMIIISYGLIYILSGIAYEKVDKTILPFVNILENYSGTDDDIVSILGKTYPYLENPLREHIEDFYNEVNSSGDTTRAFRNLEIKIENERFKEIIRNLEICSRHEANYQEIIKDTRVTLMDYLEAKQKRKAIISQGRIEIAMSIGMCSVMVVMFTGFVPNLFDILINSAIGNGLLLYCIVVLGLCLWNMISFDKKG